MNLCTGMDSHLNWVLENVGKLMLKEEFKTDLPSWKTDINDDFGVDLTIHEDGAVLSPLVRLTYLRHLRCSLKNNYLQCHKGIKDCNDMIVRRIENCAMLMEQKALRLCMIASYYQKIMNSILTEVKSLTKCNVLHKELGKTLCSDHISLRQDKNIQVEVRPLKLSRGTQTSDHRPWTETDLDSLETWRITKPKHKSSKYNLQNSKVNVSLRQPTSNFENPGSVVAAPHLRDLSLPLPVPPPNVSVDRVSHIPATALKKKDPIPSFLVRHSVNEHSNLSRRMSDSFPSDFSPLDAESYNSDSGVRNVSRQQLITIQPTNSSYGTEAQNFTVDNTINHYGSSSFSDNSAAAKRKLETSCSSELKRSKAEEIADIKSKTYDSLDDRLQEIFADQFIGESQEKPRAPAVKNQPKSFEDMTRELLGSDDDDFPLDNQEIEEYSRDFMDNEPKSESPIYSSDEFEELTHGTTKNDASSREDSDLPKVDKSLIGTKFDPRCQMKAYYISWLYERVAHVCYSNSVLERMDPERRRDLEKKFVIIFGPCCMFDNDDFTEEEQMKICRKRIAKIVCHHLRPFYRSKQIGNKPLFQILGKYLTEQLLNKHLAADEMMAKKLIHKFFEQHGRIKSAKHLPFTVKPKLSPFDDF